MCVLSGACAMAQEPSGTDEAPRADEPALVSDDDKALYTLGVALSRQMAAFSFNEDELAKIQIGFADGILGREARFPSEVYGPRLESMLESRLFLVIERETAYGEVFIEAAKQEPGAEVTSSGLVYRVLEAGRGPAPGPSDTVRVHYEGRRNDGQLFDSTREGDPPEPAEFVLDQIILCFTEGIGKMNVGGKSRLTCPPNLAYGDQGSPPDIAPGATIQFDIELIEIVPSAGPEDAGGE
jgi:hypothetical protein